MLGWVGKRGLSTWQDAACTQHGGNSGSDTPLPSADAKQSSEGSSSPSHSAKVPKKSYIQGPRPHIIISLGGFVGSIDLITDTGKSFLRDGIWGRQAFQAG